jgi:aminoglycoside phosphotransferase (APT) family kinase protein
MTDIPNSLKDVDRDWLATTLAQSHLINDASQLISVRQEPMGAGVGMMSAMSRVFLEWDASMPGLPESLVIKLPAENDTNRGVAQQFNLYLKEVNYYRDLCPQIPEISPRIYASRIDDSHNFYILMQDVSDYRMGNQVEGATLAEAELCIDVLAQLHASFWGKLDDVEWLPHMSNSENATNMQLGCAAGWPQLIDLFGQWVPDSINKRKDEYLEKIATLQEGLDKDFITLIHGDFRMDNMLYGQKPEHAPLLIVDFQGPLKGKGMMDISYLFGHSVKTEVRQQHEKALLERYVEGLKQHGITGYAFEQAWDDYRLGILYAWTVAVVIAGTMDPDNDRGFAWMAKMVERNGIAIEDLDCLSLL